MKAPSLAAIFASVALVVVAGLAAIGTPDRRVVALPPPPAPAPMARVAANGFALTSVAVELPEDTARYPAGPHVELVEANCGACHSASMVLTQPALSREQWQATVTKMREVYRAPVPEAAVPGILTYLETLGSKAISSDVAKNSQVNRTLGDRVR